MCLSRLHQVVAPASPGTVLTQDADGRRHAVSLLAFDGPPPHPGDWLVVHSGYALHPADPEEAAAIVAALGTAARPEEAPTWP